jgi:nucleoside phosphorylase
MEIKQKDCLVFAHKGEAQSFLNQQNAKLLKQSSFSIWETPKYFVLLSGEGIEESLFALSSLLAEYKDSVSRIINFGIAGALKKNIELNSIYPVSVVIAEGHNAQPEFKSFSCKDTESCYYCISARTRVKDDDYAAKLSLHAELVDREAFGFAFAAKAHKKEFLCYKLVSDLAGAGTFCFDIKEQAALYSEQMYDYYFQNLAAEETQKQKNTDDNLEQLKTLGFHFSQSQKAQFSKLSHFLKAKAPKSFASIMREENLVQITEEFHRPKDRSRALLDEIQNALNPFHNQIYDKLHTWFKDKPSSLKQVNTDPQWEKNWIRLHLEIRNEEDKQEALEFIKHLPLSEFQKIFEGEY